MRGSGHVTWHGAEETGLEEEVKVLGFRDELSNVLEVGLDRES
jgi:hypothetical protein